MCGVTGIVDLDGERHIDEATLHRMNDSLEHRGPDGSGYHFEPGVGLGHRRLSIIDLAGGKQPLYNEDRSVVVTYNGEIYNYRELADELAGLGHIFRTHCDTEVIVHAWEEWGVDCLRRFNGMFAFGLWDRNQQTLFLARDRLGIKPLHYSLLDDGRLVFGSELKAVMLCSEVSKELQPTAIEDYFTFGYIPDPSTIYRDVFKLEPGHYLKLRRGEVHKKPSQYWDVALFESPAFGGENHGRDLHQELRNHLKDAVQRRLVADVPLGAFLSGGVDSSAVVAMMRELDTSSILTCSIGFKEKRYDESEYAQIVAKAKQTDHRCEIVGASDYELLDRLSALYDEPYADSSAIPTYRVAVWREST